MIYGLPDGLTETLAERQISVSLLGASLRVTPRLYDDGDDVAALQWSFRHTV